MKAKNYVTFTPESFATLEDWETLCEEVGADPNDTYSITIPFDKEEAEIKEFQYGVYVTYYDKDRNLLNIVDKSTFSNYNDALKYAEALKHDGSSPIQQATIEKTDEIGDFIDVLYEQDLI